MPALHPAARSIFPADSARTSGRICPDTTPGHTDVCPALRRLPDLPSEYPAGGKTPIPDLPPEKTDGSAPDALCDSAASRPAHGRLCAGLFGQGHTVRAAAKGSRRRHKRRQKVRGAADDTGAELSCGKGRGRKRQTIPEAGRCNSPDMSRGLRADLSCRPPYTHAATAVPRRILLCLRPEVRSGQARATPGRFLQTLRSCREAGA